MDEKWIPAMPIASWKTWTSRGRELAGFKSWLEQFSGWLCLIHDAYGPELKEAISSVLPIRHFRNHDQNMRSKSRELTFEKGSLVLKNPEDKLTSATDSEIKVHYAMIRRGLAFQFAKLMSHKQHCEWKSFLSEALHRETPPGYTKPGIAQLLQCDKAAFGRLSCTIQNIRQDALGNYPLGVALLNLKTDPNITLYLAPLAKSSAPAPPNPGGLRANPYDAGPGPKGKGKGKGKRSSPPIPQELRGKWFKMANGGPIRFGYNCKSGSKTKAGEKCQKGWRVCAEPRCQKNHSLQQHAADS